MDAFFGGAMNEEAYEEIIRHLGQIAAHLAALNARQIEIHAEAQGTLARIELLLKRLTLKEA